MKRALSILPFILALIPTAMGQTPDASRTSPYSKWKNGPSPDPAFFPIAVWLQDPANAEKYRAAGFNTYIGLWKGPTEEQLAALKKAGMRLFCEQNAVALRHLDDPVIAGWMHGDEPDNAQELPGGKGYGPPVPPDKIVADYQKLKAADPTRPVMLNLGQGVEWDGWYGRGSRSHHPEDYPLYMKGSDIVSFDIYPAVHNNPDVQDKLWMVAGGVDRLVKWSNDNQIVWNCIECTHIGDPKRKATPQQVCFEVWSSIMHGSRGLIYFVHQFKPVFREAALLDDHEMLGTVAALNAQVTQLAPMLDAPAPQGGVTAKSQKADVPVDFIARNYNGTTYILAAAMRGASTTAQFSVPEFQGGDFVADEVWGTYSQPPHTQPLKNGVFEDTFAAWEVHLYRIIKRRIYHN